MIVIPSISKYIHLSVNAIQWCTLGYLLSFASLIIIAGSLGVRYSHFLILIIGLILFSIGSLVGGFSELPWSIILARFIQGIGAALMNAGFYVFMFVVSLYLHQRYHFSALQVGVLFLPMTLIIGFFSPIADKLCDKFGSKLIASMGLIYFLVTYLLCIFVFSLAQIHYVILLMVFILPGLAYACSSPGLLSLTMKQVPVKATGMALGVFYMTSVLGSSVGVAIATILLDRFHANVVIAITPILIFCLIATMIGLIVLMIDKVNHSTASKLII